MNWSEADYFDGPGLVRWIEDEGAFRTHTIHQRLGSSLARRLYTWRTGGAADERTAEKVLHKLDLCLRWVPDEICRAKPRRSFEADPETIERIKKMAGKDWSFTEIGAIVGVSRTTVRKYARAA